MSNSEKFPASLPDEEPAETYEEYLARLGTPSSNKLPENFFNSSTTFREDLWLIDAEPAPVETLDDRPTKTE